MRCPSCGSTKLDCEWGDDNHGSSGEICTCQECGKVSEDYDCIQAEKEMPKKQKPVHMQHYHASGLFCGFSFCGVTTFSSVTADILFTMKWEKCTCKNCLKHKKSAGNPA